MKDTFSTQKVEDILEAVADSIEAHDFPKDFIAIFDGQVYQAGNHRAILERMFRTFPAEFTELAVTKIQNSLNELDGENHTDPSSEEYWSDEEEFELGTTELDMYKSSKDDSAHECLDTIQEALSLMNRRGLINDDGSVIGRDLRNVLRDDLGLDTVNNFTQLDIFLDVCCGGLLQDDKVTKGKHPSDNRTTTYNFLNSPFKLY